MKYEEFMKRVLAGKSVNARAKEIGIAQKTLDNYTSGRSVPGCGMTIMLAEIAGIDIAEAVKAVADQELKARPKHTPTFLRTAMASILAFAVSVNLFLTPSPAQAAPAKAISEFSQVGTLYYVKLVRTN